MSEEKATKEDRFCEWAVAHPWRFFFVFMTICMTPFLLVFATISYDGTDEYALVEKRDVWYCDAPFGHYWVEMTGSGFICFYMESDLVESYTIKYLEGDVVKTLIFDAMGPELVVHLTTDMNMTFERYQIIGENFWGDQKLLNTGLHPEVYHLYIPDPYLLEASNE